MKIILFSDVHANLPAFEKAMELIDAHKPDAIYCLGDLVGYNVWPNEVIDVIRGRGIPTIAGNHDAKVKSLSLSQLNEPGKNHAYKLITEDNKQYLATLPAHIRITLNFSGSPLNILLVHGSPYSNDEYLLEDKSETEFLAVFEKADADILCFGHSHKPYHRIIDRGQANRRYKHAINTSSVGKPKDGNPEGGYVILTLNENASSAVPETIGVRFVRFDYDVEKAAKAVEVSLLPNELADMLRKAY